MSCFKLALRAVSSPGLVFMGGAARRPPRGAEGLAPLIDATSNRGEAGVCAVSPASVKAARAAALAVASQGPSVLIFPAKIPWYRGRSLTLAVRCRGCATRKWEFYANAGQLRES